MRRRAFLLAGLGTGGALFLGWTLLPPRQRLQGRHAPEVPAGSGIVALNGWLTIAPDDTVTIVAPKAEMGQGIHTALAMLVAEELDCDWQQVRVTHSPIDRIYGNVAALVDGLPIHPDQLDAPLVRGVRWLTAKVAREIAVMMTGGSSSVRDCWMVARQAGATAREALLSAAAEQTGVPIAECRTERGVVVCGTQRLRYGSLISAAVRQRPSRVVLKTPSQFTRIGVSTPRLDARDKVQGAPLYGIDVALPDMLYAAVAMPPVLGSRPLHFNQQAAMARPGVRAVVALEGTRYGDPPGVAIVAESWWQARQALPALAIEWSPSPHAALSSDGIMSTLRERAMRGDAFAFRRSGDAEALVNAPGARVMESLYEAPYLAHAAMEPINATARISRDQAEIWVGTQVPGFVRDAVAHVTAIDPSRITVHQYQLGGAFGRRLEADYAAQVAMIARAIPGVPVQVIWTREDDMRADFYRPAAVTRFRAALSPTGNVRAIVVQSASQAPFKALSQRVGFVPTMRGPDRTTAEGTWDQPYEFPAVRAAHAEVSLPVPVGSWRSVGHSHQAFFLESFIDELAQQAGQDPLAYRLALLARHPRAATVLRRATDAAGWNTPIARGDDGLLRARGLALHWSFGSYVAQVADVSIDSAQQLRVHRVVSAIDCGLIVNPAGVTQQVESAIIYGLSAALHGEITIENGRVRQGNFHEYRPLRIDECPVIETHLIASSEPPSGAGEVALPPVAPAVGNAIAVLIGRRLRQLPLRLTSRAVRGGAGT